ncbi:hypothetical protein M6B38_343830 [Iris pallida]|uniref:Uncharacterized protein n=1 Tax=Iris pallida TaxID=29817 RepID=A0AAX6GTY5_IRIPA|nr:hypothetical protein M6B38_343830 [Iris pallida]
MPVVGDRRRGRKKLVVDGGPDRWVGGSGGGATASLRRGLTESNRDGWRQSQGGSDYVGDGSQLTNGPFDRRSRTALENQSVMLGSDLRGRRGNTRDGVSQSGRFVVVKPVMMNVVE